MTKKHWADSTSQEMLLYLKYWKMTRQKTAKKEKKKEKMN